MTYAIINGDWVKIDKKYRNNECTGCKHANLITTTCKELKQKIYEETGKDSHIIDDPFERVIEEPKFEPHKKNLNICYFGGRKSFSLVDWEEVMAILNLCVNN